MRITQDKNLILAIGLVAISMYSTTAAVIALIAAILIMFKVFKPFESRPTSLTMLLTVAGIVVVGGLIPTGESNIAMPKLLTLEPTQQQVTLSGATYTGELNFRPTNNGGYTYAQTGQIAIVDSSYGSQYDIMKLIQESGTQSVKFKGTPAKFLSVSSGNFQDIQFSGQIGDQVGIFGYVDGTPSAGENTSFYKVMTLTGFNPQSGSNGGVWSITDSNTGTPNFQWNSYPTLDWYDSSATVKNGYRDNQSAAVSGQSLDIKMYPTNNGEQWTDAYLYLETGSSQAGNIKQIIITAPTGEKVTYTGLTPITDLATNSPVYSAAPATNNSGTMYSVGAFPGMTQLRTGSNTGTRAEYNVQIQYDHPATAAVQLISLYVAENAGAKTSTGGHYDANDDFVINLSSSNNSGSTGWV